MECPEEIALRAFSFAEFYEQSETEYVWGGQDPLRKVGIDCSGLVVMCYKYALVDTEYSLPVPDMTAAYMHASSSSHVPYAELRSGDLVFMGESGSENVTHIALFDCIDNGALYFIDSTQKENIDGVSRRSYALEDSRFKAFGKMLLRKN